MALNKRLLRKVRNRIAEIPESYNQSNFCQKSDDAPCGTSACIAGEAIIVSRPTIKQGIESLRRMDRRYFNSGAWTHHDAFKAGQRLLGLTEEESESMFGGEAGQWPQPFARRFANAKRPQTRARIAVDYLDECLKRGKVTW